MLQVRNLPDDVHLKLKQRAKAAGMSLSDYVSRELAKHVSSPTVAEVMMWAQRDNPGIPRAVLDEVLEEIRAERDAR